MNILCKVMQVSRGGYYHYLKRKPSKKQLFDAKLIAEIKAVAKQSRDSYGKRRIAKYLQAHGHRVGVYAARSLEPVIKIV